jgi:predicted secreted protein
MSVLNGSDILIYDADTNFPLMCQTNVTITMNDAMIDATCKQDGGYSVSLPGLRDFSFTADALVNFDEGVADLGMMSANADLFDTTSKESGGWKSVMPGLRDVTYSGEGLADFTDGSSPSKYDLTEIFNAYNNRTLLSVKFTNSISTFSQSGYISSFEVSGPMEDVATYTIEITGTGALTFA